MADWMYWITAIVFTGLGFSWGINFRKEVIIALTIDTLIKDGYIKTRGKGNHQELLKFDE